MKRKLSRTVVLLGLVSFFNDLASEMVTPFIPILIATVPGVEPVILGLVEGVADAAASFILLRGNEMGMSVAQLLLLWATLNITNAQPRLTAGAWRMSLASAISP